MNALKDHDINEAIDSLLLPSLPLATQEIENKTPVCVTALGVSIMP